jgi:hypothetical protein
VKKDDANTPRIESGYSNERGVIMLKTENNFASAAGSITVRIEIGYSSKIARKGSDAEQIIEIRYASANGATGRRIGIGYANENDVITPKTRS